MGLLTGSYKVYFYGDNSGYVSEWYNDKQDVNSADPVSVTAPGTTLGIDAVLGLLPLTLTFPNGGESWNRNSMRSITWSTSGSMGKLKLTLWQNGALIGTIAENRDPAAGSIHGATGAYIGGVAPLGTGYTIKIEEQGTGVSDESNGPFSIVKVKVNAPNGGESWQIGSTQNITWLTKIISNNLRIVLFKNGVKVGNIVDSIDLSLGTYSWTVGSMWAVLRQRGQVIRCRCAKSALTPETAAIQIYFNSTLMSRKLCGRMAEEWKNGTGRMGVKSLS